MQYFKQKMIKLRMRFGFLRAWLFRTRKYRTPDSVKKYYNKLWTTADIDERMDRTSFRELNGRQIQCRTIDVRKMRVEYLSRSLRELSYEKDGVQSVLELGSGSGFNILALAALHPEIKTWRGLDFAPGSKEAADSLLRHPPLKQLRYVTELDSEVIKSWLAGSDIRFEEGDMLKSPFSDSAFDVAFSCQAIEQIPHDYLRAFTETRRVVTKGAIFLEEFSEAQDIFQLMNLKTSDMFCASYKEVERAGFRVLKFEPFPLNPDHLSLGLCACSVK